MIITINGKPGSGKSSIAEMLSKKLGYRYIDIGETRRQIAKKRGMTLQEYNKLGETSDETDKDVDEYLKTLNMEDNLVISSRTAFHFIPKSMKILLDVNLHEAAKRIFSDTKLKTRNESANISSIAEIEESLHERMRSDIHRYKKYYQIDVYDPSQFDLVLDTTGIPLDGVFNKVTEFLESRKTS